MKAIVYTTNCPQCRVLESILKNEGIEFEKCTDVDKMLSLGMKSAPGLEIDGVLMNFQQAIAWVKERAYED